MSEQVTLVLTSTVYATEGLTSADTSEASEPTSPGHVSSSAGLGTSTGYSAHTSVASSTIASDTACPAPTNGPCDPPEIPYDPISNKTFGCDPGFVCDRPKPRGCSLWADSPADDYVCKSRHCIISPPFSRVQWPEGETGSLPADKGYFNLNPNAFGLPYSIFEYETIVKRRVGEEFTPGSCASATELSVFPTPSPQGGQRLSPIWHGLPGTEQQDESDPPTAPAVCFDDCNNCYKEALAVGKSPALCVSDSQFQQDYKLCVSCIDANAEDGPSVRRQYVDHKFAQFLGYCERQDTAPTHSTSTDAPAETATTSEPLVETETQPSEGAATSTEPPTPTAVEETSLSSRGPAPEPTSGRDQPGNGPGETPAPTSAGVDQPPTPVGSDEASGSALSSGPTPIGTEPATSRPEGPRDDTQSSRTTGPPESLGPDEQGTNPTAGSSKPTPTRPVGVSSSMSSESGAPDNAAPSQSDATDEWPTAATPSFAIGVSSSLRIPDLGMIAPLVAGVFMHRLF